MASSNPLRASKGSEDLRPRDAGIGGCLMVKESHPRAEVSLSKQHPVFEVDGIGI
jgi:hypothetical protein